jgi:hypothetical protein
MGQIPYGRVIGTFGISTGSRNMMHLPLTSGIVKTMALIMRMMLSPTIIFETMTSFDIQFARWKNTHLGYAIYTS